MAHIRCTVFFLASIVAVSGHAAAKPTAAGSYPGMAVPPPAPARVVGTSRVVTDELVILRTEHDSIEASPEHRFSVVGRGFLPAREIQAGDRLDALSPAGDVAALSVEIKKVPPHLVYNLLVDGSHTFRVGHDGLLVHNGTCVERLGLVHYPTGEGIPFTRNPNVVEPNIGPRYWHIDFSHKPPALPRLPLPHSSFADDATVVGKGSSRVHYYEQVQWPKDIQVHRGADGVLRSVEFTKDPTVAIDRVQVDHLTREFGMSAPASSVMRTSDGRVAYVAELDEKTGGLRKTPEMKMLPGNLRPLSSEALATTTKTPYKAYAIISRYAVLGKGHAGWAFEFPNAAGEKRFLAGSTENWEWWPYANATHKGNWVGVFADEKSMLAEWKRRNWLGYTSFRATEVGKTPSQAWADARVAVAQSRADAKVGYDVARSNCVTDAHCILDKAGFLNKKEDPDAMTPLGSMYPNDWVDHLGGKTIGRWGPELLLPPNP